MERSVCGPASSAAAPQRCERSRHSSASPAVAAAFWFCREFCDDGVSALIVTALIAVSPFHIVYAHEAREYSLWTLALFILGATFLRAHRAPSPERLAWYAFAVALSLYADLLSVYVIAALALYALGTLARRPRSLLLMAAATAAGTATFGLWIVRIWAHWTTLTNYMSWGAFKLSAQANGAEMGLQHRRRALRPRI